MGGLQTVVVCAVVVVVNVDLDPLEAPNSTFATRTQTTLLTRGGWSAPRDALESHTGSERALSLPSGRAPDVKCTKWFTGGSAPRADLSSPGT